jgi:hypothetical protein
MEIFTSGTAQCEFIRQQTPEAVAAIRAAVNAALAPHTKTATNEIPARAVLIGWERRQLNGGYQSFPESVERYDARSRWPLRNRSGRARHPRKRCSAVSSQLKQSGYDAL